jgi:hypothetical protein
MSAFRGGADPSDVDRGGEGVIKDEPIQIRVKLCSHPRPLAASSSSTGVKGRHLAQVRGPGYSDPCDPRAPVRICSVLLQNANPLLKISVPRMKTEKPGAAALWARSSSPSPGSYTPIDRLSSTDRRRQAGCALPKWPSANPSPPPPQQQFKVDGGTGSARATWPLSRKRRLVELERDNLGEVFASLVKNS